MADTIYKNSTSVGSELQDLILKTTGKVIIKVKDKYYPIDFKNLTGDNSGSDSKSNVIVLNTQSEISRLAYPGDNNLVMSLDGYMYLCSNGKLNEISIKNIGTNTEFGDLTINGQLTVNARNGNSPFKVSSNVLNKNLNAEYLNGISSDKFAQKHLNEKITGQWLFNQIVYVNETLKSTNAKNSLYHTVLDFKNSSLDIDYINVRKALRVYEYIINTIKATNGSLWVSDSAKVKEVYPLTGQAVMSNTYDRIRKDYMFGKLDNNWHTVGEWFAIFIPKYNGEEIDNPVLIDLNNSTQVTRANNLLYANVELSRSLGYMYNATYPNGTVREERYDVSYWSDVLYNCLNINRDINVIFSGDYISFKVECSNDTAPFWINDVIRCQKIENLTEVYNYEGLVCEVNADTIAVKFKENGVKIDVDDSLVRIDNIVNPDRRGAIYLTSSDYKAPYIDIIDNSEYQYKVKKTIYDESSAKPNKDEVYVDNSNIKIRLGRLDGLAYDQVFGRMSGFGAYLQGKVDPKFVPTGNTTLEKIENTAKMYNGGIYIKDAVLQLGSITNTNHTIGILLNPDGSGWLAQKGIYWNNSGSLTLSGDNSNLTIENANLYLGRNDDGSYKIHLNKDGSGWLANKGIIWDSSGSLVIGPIPSSIYVKGTCLDNNQPNVIKIYKGGKLIIDKSYNSRGHTLIQINRNTLNIVSETNFDTYASTTNLTNTLNAISNSSNFIILISYDACSLDTQLINALVPFGSGAYNNAFSSIRRPHVFIGYYGLSKGSAIENLQLNSTPAEATCYVIDGMISGTNTSGISDQIAKDTYNAKNETARKLGYDSWEDMELKTGGDSRNNTIISDGYIRTSILDADKIISEIIQVEKITTGNLTVTNGAKIGGFSISGNDITCIDPENDTRDTSIILKNTREYREAKIGTNVSNMFSVPILCSMKSIDPYNTLGSNVCMVLRAAGSMYDSAIIATGNITSEGLVTGTRRQLWMPRMEGQIVHPRFNANIMIALIHFDRSGVGLPMLDDIFGNIGIIKPSEYTSFSILYTVCCDMSSSSQGSIYGRNTIPSVDMNTSNFARIIDHDGNYVEKIDIARGDVLQFVLDYVKPDLGIANPNNGYVAYLVSRSH